MKRNLDLPLLTLDGKPFEDKATLKDVVFAAVTVPLQDDNTDGAQKMKLYGLAQRAHAGGVVELSAEEITLIKARIAKLYAVLTVGAAYDLLEKDAQE